MYAEERQQAIADLLVQRGRLSVNELADRFTPLFDEWATGRPRRTGTSFHADLDAFAAWLRAGRHLP